LPTRVVVTGIGAVTPLGNDRESTWSALVAGKSGIAGITLFDPAPYAVRIFGEVKGFEPARYVEPKEARRLDRSSLFAVAAAKEAISDAGLAIDETNRDEVGVVVGTAIGGCKILLDHQKLLEERGPARASPNFIQYLVPDCASGQIAISTGIRGPNHTVVSACASGGHAIGEAMEMVRRGDVHTAVVGGTDACLLPVVLAGFIQMRVLAANNAEPEKAARPFDAKHDGFVMAEGSAMFVIEDLDRARARGAHVYAEVIGYGSSNDAFHLAAPAEQGEGEVRAMRMALRKAGIRPEEVDYLNPHGSATPVNDKYETIAIKQVFGEHAYKLAISSTKSMAGHMFGGAGAIESLACVMAIDRSVIHPTINLDEPDPDCDLDYVPNVARQRPVRVAMKAAMGLGGHNSCVIFRKCGD
jgi:beta-ketoacyl-acyl-carrier-protein synthase II